MKIYTARVMSSSPHLGSPFELLFEPSLLHGGGGGGGGESKFKVDSCQRQPQARKTFPIVFSSHFSLLENARGNLENA